MRGHRSQRVVKRRVADKPLATFKQPSSGRQVCSTAFWIWLGSTAWVYPASHDLNFLEPPGADPHAGWCRRGAVPLTGPCSDLWCPLRSRKGREPERRRDVAPPALQGVTFSFA
jgi:hypothetical protein